MTTLYVTNPDGTIKITTNVLTRQDATDDFIVANKHYPILMIENLRTGVKHVPYYNELETTYPTLFNTTLKNRGIKAMIDKYHSYTTGMTWLSASSFHDKLVWDNDCYAPSEDYPVGSGGYRTIEEMTVEKYQNWLNTSLIQVHTEEEEKLKIREFLTNYVERVRGEYVGYRGISHYSWSGMKWEIYPTGHRILSNGKIISPNQDDRILLETGDWHIQYLLEQKYGITEWNIR